MITFDVVDANATATGGAGSSGGDHDAFDARETWVLRFDGDAYKATLSTDPSDSTQQWVTTTGASNGVPDVEEALAICGLQSANGTAASLTCVNGSSTGTNAIVVRLFQERLRASARTRFEIAEDGTRDADSMDIEFLLPGEQGSLSALPTWSTSQTSNSAKAYSEMDVGGDTAPNSSNTGYFTTIGQAFYDARNRRREANLNSGSSNSSLNNGIFCLDMFKSLMNVSTTGTEWGAVVLAKFQKAKGGTPVGEDTNDAVVLADTFDRTSGSNTQAQNDRYDAIHDAIEQAALSVSGVLAHEIGHSVGLVPDDAP